MSEYNPFNPLDRENLAASVGEALLEKEPVQLGNLESFVGAGVYAIYYTGDFAPYRKLADANTDGSWRAPIYVGKAIPAGGRKGGMSSNAKPKPYLKKRLDEHAESIRSAASTLNIDDFFCRYLVVEDIWIPLGENLMISRFSPIWNTLIDGFGNHDPGKGRYNGLRPRWDVLHPGRGWAEKCRERPETAETIAREIQDYLRTRPIGLGQKLFKRDE